MANVPNTNSDQCGCIKYCDADDLVSALGLVQERAGLLQEAVSNSNYPVERPQSEIGLWLSYLAAFEYTRALVRECVWVMEGPPLRTPPAPIPGPPPRRPGPGKIQHDAGDELTSAPE